MAACANSRRSACASRQARAALAAGGKALFGACCVVGSALRRARCAAAGHVGRKSLFPAFAHLADPTAPCVGQRLTAYMYQRKSKQHATVRSLMALHFGHLAAGVDAGSRLRVRSEGNAGRRGGPPGDLYVFIGVKVRGRGACLRCGDDFRPVRDILAGRVTRALLTRASASGHCMCCVSTHSRPPPSIVASTL